MGSVSAAQERAEERAEKKAFLIGFESRYYRYSEPSIPVIHAGLLYGVWGEWYWSSALGNGKLYGNLLYGYLDYDGASYDPDTDSSTLLTSKTNDWISKINSRLEYKLNEFLYFFAGAGFRYLYDRGEDVGRTSFYTRIGNWAYLPLGGGLKYENFLLELEYDLIVYGNIKSNLSEVKSSYANLSHSQSGHGLLLTAGYQLNNSWSLRGIFESWDLDETSKLHFGWNSSGNPLFGEEPENSSQSYGIRLGYLF